MSLSWWQGLVNRGKLKLKSSPARRLGRRRTEARRTLFEPLESRVLLSSGPVISLTNGLANNFVGGQGTWIQIPVRIDNLQDSLGDTGLESEGVELNYSTTVNVAAQNVSQPANSGFTESGDTVTVITQGSSGFVKGEAVTTTAWNNPAYDGTFTIASVGTTSFTYTDTGVTGLTPSGGGTVTASFFDQGAPQSAASEQQSITSGRPNFAPVVVQGPLLPSAWGWNSPAGNAGTVTIANQSPNSAQYITTTDPTKGGKSPDGDILAYVFLHVISGTTSAAYDSSIPISVVSGTSTYLIEAAGNQPEYTLSTSPNATVQVVADSAAIEPPSHNGATESGSTVTITTRSAINLTAGESVNITGVNDGGSPPAPVTGYDGTFTIASVGTTSFTYTDSTTGLPVAGNGTVTEVGSVPVTELSVSGLSSVKSGSTYTVPVMLAPSTPGGQGISDASADILFDPTYINATSFKVSAGSLIPSTWTNISKGLDTQNIYSSDGIPPSTDTNCLILQAAMPGSNSFATIASNSAGSLWVLTFTTMPGVSGSTVLNLVPDALPSVETSTALIDPAYGTGYTLSPAPTWNEAAPGSPQPSPYQIPSVINPVDGVINFLSGATTTTTVTSSNPSVAYDTAVTFTATVSATSSAPTGGSVDFYDTTTSTDLGAGTFGASNGTTSTWTFTTSAKTLNATGGDTVTATYTPGTGFNGSSGTTTQAVTALPVTVTGITAANKTYNGSTTAVLQGLGTASLVGLVSGDTVTLGTSSAAGTFASKGVGQNITVSVSGLTIGGSQAEDYALTQPTTTANITAATLTVTGITAANKTYNGNATAALQGLGVASLVGVVSGDAVTLGTSSAAGTFASKDVGQNITVSVSGLTLGGLQAGDYTLTQPTTTANITAATLTVTGVTAANKTYNGNATAALQGLGAASLVGMVSGDTVTLGTSTAAGTFASKDVGQNITVSVSGLTLGGLQAGDYTLTQPTTTANITAATLTVTGITAANKTYSGNATAALQGLGVASLVGVVSGDAVTLGTGSAAGTFASKDVGQNITVSVSGLTISGTAVTAGDYSLTQPTTTANITAATLTVTGITAANKTYNGNTTAALQGLGVASLVGLVSGDAVTLGTSSAAGAFASKDVGQNITVSVSGLTLGGLQAGDYTLTQPTTTANITAATLTVTGVTAANKTYNGNATAALQGLGVASLVGVVSGDAVTLGTSSAAGTFASKDVGQNITVSVSGLTLGGLQAGDYTLTQPTTTANITAATLTVTGITAANKTYNGNATAALQGLGVASLVGVVSGDAVTLGTSSAAGTFASKDVGQNITVSVSGLTLGGLQAGDYTLTQPTTTANITAATLTVTGVTAADKTYNGNATAALQGLGAASLVGLVSGDAVTLGTSTAAGTFASKDVGQNITVSVSGLTLGGLQAGDYTLTQPTTTANVTAATLTVTGITAADKTYNGSATATLQGLGAASLVGLVSGDAVTLGTSSAAGTFASKDVGQNITVSVSGLTIGGLQAGDYTLTQPTTTANVTAATLTVTGITAADKTYNGSATAALQGLGAASLVGLVSGDAVTLGTSTAAGTFASKDVGQNITVSVSGLTLGGLQAGDYTLTQPTTTANITAATLTVTGITAANKTYNGNATAALQGLGAASLVGAVSGDAVTLGTSTAAGTFASKDVGQNITVSVSGLTIGGLQAGDYTLTQPTTTANITAATLTVTGITAADKTYNGNATAALQGLGAASLVGVVSGDAVTLGTSSAAGTFASKDVGQNITVSVSGLTIGGLQAGDYTLTQPATTANITAATLTVTGITAADKIYNGNATAALQGLTAASLVGAVSGDAVTLGTGSAAGTFASKDVGQNITVSVSGLTLGGLQAGDYTLTQPATTANITPMLLTVTAHGVNKKWDGTTTATVTLSDNHVPGDDVTDHYASAAFSNSGIANNVQVSVTGITITGSDIGDYTLVNNAATTRADILSPTLVNTTTTVTSSKASVVYGTAVTFTATVSATSGAPTGSVDFYDTTTSTDLGAGSLGSSTGTTATWTFTTSAKTFNVTTGDTITATYTGSIGFAGSSNTTSQAVTALSITATGITAADKTYNGNTTATLQGLGAASLVGVLSGDAVTLGTSGAAGTFASKDLGQNITVSVSGLTLGGLQAGDYTLTQPTTTANITAATLTVTGITAANKTYNGNATAALQGLGAASLLGVVSGDAVTLGTSSAAGTFASKDVGQNITVSVTGLTLGGLQAGDYSLTQPATTANITAATLTVTGITAANKTYNGNATAALQGLAGASLLGLVSGDAVTLGTGSATGTFASKDVGQNITVSVSGLTIGGLQAGDYTLTQPATTANITAATLTVTGITAANKTYNGNATAALQGLAGASLLGLVSGDAVTLGTGSAAGTFASKDVGQNITVSVSGLTLGGLQAGDYTLTQPTTTANITAATLTVTGITAANKTYNGNVTAALQGLAAASLVGVVSGDAVTLGTGSAAGTFASKDVGQNITVSVSGLTLGGSQAGDYTLTQPSTTANITAATLTVTGITAADKTYNGNATAALQGLAGASLVGVVSGDAVTLGTGSAAGTFASKGVGQNITVSVTGLTLGGSQAGDYTVTQPTTTANITAATLTVTGITAANKTYNGNATAALQGLAAASLVGVVSGDAVTLGTSSTAGTFASKDVGQNITVSVTGLTLGGLQAADYTLTQPSTTANITAATLTVTGITAANKTYNGNATAALQGLAGASLVGVVSGDAVTLGTSSAAGTFASKDVGQNITVSVSGLTLGGLQAGDYTLTQPSTTANITAATLTVTGITAADKTYNGNATAALQGLAGASLVGVVSGDAVTLGTGSAAGTFASKDMGQNITVSVSGLTIGGSQAGDYTLTQPSTTANITAATLTVTGITAANKTYNGNATAALQGLAAASLVGVVSGDAVTLGTSGAAGTFASKDVGQNITVSVTGLTLGGSQAADYTLTQPATTANITAATLAVTGITAAGKTYDGGTTAALQGLAAASLVGVVSGDTVTLGTGSAAGAFASKDVGKNITVSVTGLTLGGSQAADYTLTQPTTTANITAATLTVTGITAVDKTYNGNTTATLGGLAAASLVGTVSGDTVTLGTGSAAGTFASKDVGQNITVSVSGLTLGGSQASDYALTQPTTTANITPMALTVTATGINKGYDGTTTATVTLSDNHMPGDSVTDNYASASFSQSTPGNWTVSVSGITISGSDKGDYALQNTTATTTASILNETVAVIDDSYTVAEGFSTTGTWSDWTNQGYDGSVHQATPVTSINPMSTATWTFNGLVPNQEYMVETAWTGKNTNRATNAPYTISGGPSTLTLPVTVNQQLAPVGVSADNWTWQELGVYKSATTTGKLVVTLSNYGANGNVIADAVRVEPVPGFGSGTSITVQAGTGAANDPVVVPTISGSVQTTVSFGTVAAGATARKTFTVFNGGSDELSYTLSSLPAGYTLYSGSGTANVPFGGSAQFVLQETTSAVGTNSGTVTLSTLDASTGTGAGSFSFPVTGTVLNVAPTATISASSSAVYQGSPVTVSLINPVDPVGADQTAGYHYNFATTAAGLATVEAGLPTSGQATTYATASATNSYTFTATTTPSQTFYAEIINANGLSSNYSITVTVQSTAMIIDDSYGAAGGWTTTGKWTNWTGQGYDNDVHQATPVTSTNPVSTATWTFNGLSTSQYYEVETTWTGKNSNRATNAPYTISGGAVTLPVTVNQQLSPVGVSGDNGTWQELGLYEPTSGTLKVTLSNSGANGNVIADAVRLVPLLVGGPAAMMVQAPTGAATDPVVLPTISGSVQTSVNLGTASLGGPSPTETFRVTNDGGTTLSVTSVSLPAGFTPVAPFTVAAHGFTTFTVGLSTSAAGAFSGNVIITSNDSIDSPFSVPITGTVKLPSQVIDDSAGAAGGFTTTGVWQPWAGLSLAYGGTDHEAMTANATATWTFKNLTVGATYDVYITWPANTNRTAKAPYTVTANGAVTNFPGVNQKSQPSVQMAGSGPTGGNWSWYELSSGGLGGAYTVGANGQLVVQVSNKGLPARSNAANNVEADAVMIVQQEPELAAGGVGHNPNATSVTASEAMPLVQEAELRWAEAGANLSALGNVQVVVGNLPGTELAASSAMVHTIYLDTNAQGYGWFIDPTPGRDSEFPVQVAKTEERATSGPAAGEMDLLTVIMHEMGHFLGYQDLDPQVSPYDLMSSSLAAGVRRLPDSVAAQSSSAQATDAVLAALAQPQSGATANNAAGYESEAWWLLYGEQ